jgi:RNA 3'-terminal phosphate cyclase
LLAHHHRDAAADCTWPISSFCRPRLRRSVALDDAASRHLTTNAWVVRQFLQVPINITGDEGEPGAVRVG